MLNILYNNFNRLGGYQHLPNKQAEGLPLPQPPSWEQMSLDNIYMAGNKLSQRKNSFPQDTPPYSPFLKRWGVVEQVVKAFSWLWFCFFKLWLVQFFGKDNDVSTSDCDI